VAVSCYVEEKSKITTRNVGRSTLQHDVSEVDIIVALVVLTVVATFVIGGH
jgi:hypothetical protein